MGGLRWGRVGWRGVAVMICLAACSTKSAGGGALGSGDGAGFRGSVRELAGLLEPGETDGFWPYYVALAAHRRGIRVPRAPEAATGGGGTWILGELLSISGLSAVEATLGLDEVLMEGERARDVRWSESVDRLRGPELGSVELVQGSGVGPELPAVFFCPVDSLYLGFRKASAALRLADDVSLWQGSVGRLSDFLHLDGTPFSLGQKLGLESDEESRAVYREAVGSLVLVLDDPYLSVAPELTLILEVLDPGRLDDALAAWDEARRSSGAGGGGGPGGVGGGFHRGGGFGDGRFGVSCGGGEVPVVFQQPGVVGAGVGCWWRS